MDERILKHYKSNTKKMRKLVQKRPRLEKQKPKKGLKLEKSLKRNIKLC
jgi:hypothetical protein